MKSLEILWALPFVNTIGNLVSDTGLIIQSKPNFIDNFCPLFSRLISQVSSLLNETLSEVV